MRLSPFPEFNLELGLFVRRLIDVSDAFLNHLGHGLFQLTSLLGQSENVFIQQIPIFFVVTQFDDADQDAT